ncbi:MAG: hypothetical protein KJ882_00785, partial [Proteobacteria bacterium]|nr:hypothetical protein [Pseudomonadota bacterium]
EPLSKRFSLVKVKAGENINRRNTWSISRIKIFAQRRDWPKWDVLKLAHELIRNRELRMIKSKANSSMFFKNKTAAATIRSFSLFPKPLNIDTATMENSTLNFPWLWPC